MDKNKLAQPILRFLAFLIDLSINLLPWLYVLNIVSKSDNIETLLNNLSLFAFFVVYPVVYAVVVAFMVSVFGGTFGKLLVGIRIVSADGKNISFWRAVWRNVIGHTISGLILWLGFVWIIIDKDFRGWHDKLADTYVVVKNKAVAALGVSVLFIIIYLETILVAGSINNFRANGDFYNRLLAEIRQEIESRPRK